MSIWARITGTPDNRSRQQRNANAVRAADHAGHQQINTHRTSRSTTAWNPDRTGRRWWQSG